MPCATVFGASTNHGRSVADALVTSQYNVKAIVTSPCIIPGAETIVMTSPCGDVIRQALTGADVVYVSTQTDFKDPNCMEKERNEGQLIANYCRELCINHVILCTQLSPRQALGIPARHCDIKAQIEDYMNNLRLPLTCIEIPFLYESLYSYFKPEMIGDRKFRLAIPMGLSSMDCISARDVGPVVSMVARQRNQYLNKTLALAADKIKVKEMVAVLSKCCDVQVTDRQISVFEFKELGWPGCVDIANYFDFITRVDQRFNVTSTRELHPQAMTFIDWADTYRQEIKQMAFEQC